MSRSMDLRFGLAAFLICLGFSSSLWADVIVYSNDFESDTDGFEAGGTITALSRTILPTDSAGLGSANQSNWLGRVGFNVPKSRVTADSVTLEVSGLQVGETYDLDFDLFVGGSWDGSASSVGPDSWRVAVDGTLLVNTTFTNGNFGQEYTDFSPQKYSDTTFLGFDGPNFGKFTGAEHFFTTGGQLYSQHYGIYHFGHGAGNPLLEFVATSGSASIEFARFGNTGDSSDEYWAIDNIVVSTVGVPEPGTLGLLALGTFLGCIHRRQR